MKDAEKETPKRSVGIRAELAQIVKLRIKESAENCFKNKGYKATSIREISEGAGVTHTTFYNYFKNKSAVIIDIGRDWESELNKIAKSLDDRLTEPSLQSISSWLAEYSLWWMTRHDVVAAYIDALEESDVSRSYSHFCNKMLDHMPNFAKAFSEQRGGDLFRTKGSLLLFMISQSMYLSHSVRDEIYSEGLKVCTAEILWQILSADLNIQSR